MTIYRFAQMLHQITLNAVFHLRFEKIYEEAQRVSSSRAPQLSAEPTPEDHGLLCQHKVITLLKLLLFFYTSDKKVNFFVLSI